MNPANVNSIAQDFAGFLICGIFVVFVIGTVIAAFREFGMLRLRMP